MASGDSAFDAHDYALPVKAIGQCREAGPLCSRLLLVLIIILSDTGTLKLVLFKLGRSLPFDVR